MALSGDPVRALAVLVVATPCPLILAAPIAIVCGMSRTARAGVIVKDGAAVEGLARTRAVLLDKTGTLTLGSPRRAGARVRGVEEAELLRLAASVDQVSAHGLAEAIVHAAEARELRLSLPRNVGVAMGVAGAAAAAEAADAVIVVDRLGRLADAMAISRRAVAIARQSVLAGMGLTRRDGRRGRGMVAAARGGAAAGRHRRRRDPQRAAGAAGLRFGRVRPA